MKKVFQSKVSEVDGDCMRAVVASLLELDLNEVPNFIEYREASNFEMMKFFFDKKYHPCFIYKHNYTTEQLIEIANICGGVNGYFYASVPSQTYKDGGHAVVVDLNLNIVHDPNPNQKCLGLKPDDIEYILTVGDFLIPDHIKMKHEIDEEQNTEKEEKTNT